MMAGTDKELESFRRRFQHMTEAVQNSSYRLDWTTCNEVVLEHGSMRLRRFLGEGTSFSAGVPVLLVYSHVNSPHVLDLMTGHSLVEKLVDAGHAVYLLDWGDVNESDRVRPLANYILDYIDLAVDAICRTREVSSVSLVGVCQGGTFSLCYASIFPDRIDRLATLITPVDFHAGGSLLTHWCKHVDTGLLERATSNIPGTVVNGVFQLLRPFSDLRRQVQMIAQSGNGENLELMARMDQWVFSGPDQPARAFVLEWFPAGLSEQSIERSFRVSDWHAVLVCCSHT